MYTRLGQAPVQLEYEAGQVKKSTGAEPAAPAVISPAVHPAATAPGEPGVISPSGAPKA